MKTTVQLDNELLVEVKRHAAEKGMTLTAVLDQALREMLARRKELINRERVSLTLFEGKGLQPGVDLDDSAALLDLMSRENGSH
jgi:hypothetical protein